MKRAWGPSSAPRAAPQAAKQPWGAGGANGARIPAPKAAAAKSGSGDTPAFTVSTSSKRDDIGIDTLVGDYAERGTNHGRKYFQKMQAIPGHEDVKVFLYYWDTRDGADFSGWWFGNELGGSQVWARAPQHGQSPPRLGWRIPWDAKFAQPGLLAVDPFSGTSSSASSGAAGATAAGNSQHQLRVKKATEQTTAAETAANRVITDAKAKTASGTASLAALKQLQDALTRQQTALKEASQSVLQDLTEARKAGPSAQPQVAELSKLPPRIRTVQSGLIAQAAKVTSLVLKAQKGGESEQAPALNPEEQRKAEERDTKAFTDVYIALQDVVSLAEDSVEAVTLMAAPLVADPPDDHGETLKKALEEIESAATDAQHKIMEARKEANTKLQGARNYAPQARQKALSEISSLQAKLTEAQKKLGPYKSFKKEFSARVEAKKSLTEVTEQLASVELEAEKAAMMSLPADSGQMSEDEIAGVDEVLKPAKTALLTQTRALDAKLRGASPAVKEELSQLKQMADEVRKKLDEVAGKMKRQTEGLSTQQVVATAEEKLTKAEGMLTACQEAEMPFLKGIEVLPDEESGKAIQDSEVASRKAESALNQAKSYVITKLGEAKRLSKDVAKGFVEDLNGIKERVEISLQKVTRFKKDTAERKTAALLSGAMEGISKAEAKVKLLAEAAKIFVSDDLEKSSVEELKAAGEVASAAEKAASAACVEAKRLHLAKQKEARGADATAALGKLHSRLSAAQAELAKYKSAASSGAKLARVREALTQEEEKLEKAEADADRAEVMSKPDGGAELSENVARELEELLVTTEKALKTVLGAVEAHMPGASSALKASLQKLIDRAKKGVSKLATARDATRDRREEVLSATFVTEGEKKIEELDAAVKLMNDAELPFLKGVEVLPLGEASETLKQSLEASEAVQKAINQARTFIASKNLVVKQYKSAKTAKDAFAKMSENISVASQALSQFRKDTENRKKSVKLQEAEEKATAAEAEVKKVGEAVEPFGAESEKAPSDEELEKIAAITKDAKEKLTAASACLAECKGPAQKGSSLPENVSKLQSRVQSAQSTLNKANRVVSNHQAKLTAKKVVAEAGGLASEAEAVLKKATDECAPLLESGGEEFLVAASTLTLATALRAHMKEKELTEEAVFAEANDGKKTGKIAKDKFIKYLEGLPEAIQHEEIAFTEARRTAIFSRADADGDGALSLDEFKALFKKTFVVVKSVSVTDVYEVAKSKTVAKVDPGVLLEALGDARKDDETGMFRVECALPDGEQRGWVTMEGNQGSKYLEVYTPYVAFTNKLEKSLTSFTAEMSKVAASAKAKSAQLHKEGAQGSITAEKQEFTKLQQKVSDAQRNLEALKKKVINGKREYGKKEAAEKVAHIEARERRAAEALLEAATTKMTAMEAAEKAVKEKASPLVSIDMKEVHDFATPLSVKEDTERLLAVVSEAVKEAKATIKEQMGQLSTTTQLSGPMAEAKKDLTRMLAKADATERSCKGSLEAARKRCDAIAEAKRGEAAAAVREELLRNSSSAEQLFEKLAKEDRISEDAFCEHIKSVKALNMPPEHAKLLCRHVEAGGVGRRRFLGFIQQYYVVVKDIAVTNSLDVSTGKTLRKAESEEVLEVIEGPKVDDKLGLTRVKAKLLKDNLEGWITMKGNQGTPFLQEVEKPFIACASSMQLDKEFAADGNEAIRSLDAEEVLELVEGPRMETHPSIKRAKGKAMVDDALGWVTLQDGKGTTFVEKSDKYYSCTTSVAMTDAQDIKDCKVVRKLVVGELILTLGTATSEGDSGISRINGRALKDGVEGWITVKGNAGTVYVEPSSKYYSVLQEVELTKKFASQGSESVRTLKEGEAFLVLDGPREERFEPEKRVRVRAQRDQALGWISLKGANVKPWTAMYKAIKVQPLQDARVSEGATDVRELALRETVEHLEGPVMEAGALRMRCRAQKDGAIGWVTIKDGEGKTLLATA